MFFDVNLRVIKTSGTVRRSPCSHCAERAENGPHKSMLMFVSCCVIARAAHKTDSPQHCSGCSVKR